MATDQNAFSIAQSLAQQQAADIVLFNGTISRTNVLEFVEQIFENQANTKLTLILVTDGGDPDAAYKMSRYLLHRYERVTIVISGSCKSAGTLMAIGAHEIVFSPFGELGPLDIQSYKIDNLSSMESGLTISEAIDTLVRKAIDLHSEHYSKIMSSTGRVVSFASAAKVATDFSTALFSPIFGRIDPYDVVQKARSMRIANDYGERLSQKAENLQPGSLDKLTRGYPSHSFVIDCEEAKELFKRCRTVSSLEADLIDSLSILARTEFKSAKKPLTIFLSSVDKGGSSSPKGEGLDESEHPSDDAGDPGSAAEEIANASGSESTDDTAEQLDEPEGDGNDTAHS